MFQLTKHNSRKIRRIKSAVSPFVRGENGIGALVAVLVVLVFGALILTPLLVFMNTGQRAGGLIEERTSEFYSADAGVEKASWQLQYGGLIPADDPRNPVWDNNTYVLFSSGPPDTRLTINGDKVAVSIENEYGTGLVYRITSTATDPASGKSTTIVSRITPFWGFQGNLFGNAITSKTNVAVGTNEVIFGNIQCTGLFSVGSNSKIYGDVRCGTIDNGGTIFGSATYKYTSGKGVGDVRGTRYYPVDPPNLDTSWPTYCQLDAFYDEETSDTIIPSTISTHGPWAGRTSTFTVCDTPPALGGPAGTDLTIDLKTKGVIVELSGNVIVTGNLSVTGNKGELDLNGQTVYVRGTVSIASGVNLTGAGLIISVGNINAQPNLSAGGSKYAAAVVYYDGNSSPTNGTWATKTITETYLLDLNDVWGVSSGGNDTIYAVGNGCEVQKYTGATNGTGPWTEIDISTAVPTKPNLNGVWGVNANSLYAVGVGGHIVRYDGTTWSDSVVTAADLTKPDLNSVWGAASDNVFAVGGAGAVFHYDGAAWTQMSSGTVEKLNGVWGTSDNTVYAVGDAGTILRYSGTAWSKFPISDVPTNQNLNAVWAGSSSNVFVVGDGGTILRYNGSIWQKMTSPTPVNLRDVYGTSDGTVFAVGEFGVALKWTAALGWRKMTMDSAMTRDLNGVWGSSSTDVYGVGATQSNFMFIMSTNGTVNLQPANNGQFLGAMAGGGNVNLQPNQTLVPSGDAGNVSFPEYRWMVISTYVINLGR
jgi:hypothetical protein